MVYYIGKRDYRLFQEVFMAGVLIFGETSYIGSAFASFAGRLSSQEFIIKKISSRDGSYKAGGLEKASCVLYCAGIAHRKAKDALHYGVNRDLAVSVAK